MAERTQSKSPWFTLAAACLGLGLLLIDLFAVNVALPTIGRTMDADISSMEWIVTVYVLALGVFPVTLGRLGDLKGRKRVYQAGLVLFIAASLGCGLATNIGWLIGMRSLQGIGAAVMMPLSLSLVVAAFPASQRGLAVGIWGGVSGLGLIAGPLIGGLLVHGDNWRWIFLINLPLGLLALAAAQIFVTESRDTAASGKIDWVGTVLLSSGLFLLIAGLFLVRRQGWADPTVWASLAGSGALLTLFTMVQRRVANPLIDLSLFQNKTFVASIVTAALFSAAVFGSQPFVSLLMQNTWGFSPLMGGLAFLPATALVAVTLVLGGWLGGKLGRQLRLVVMGGSLAVLISSLLLARLTPASGYMDGLLLPFIIRGVGIGLVITTASLAAMSALPAEKSGLASGLLTMSRQIGTAAGIALLGSVYLGSVENAWARAAAAPEVPGALMAIRNFSIPLGDGLAELSNAIIVSGYVRLSLVSALLCALALASALFIRYRVVSDSTGAELTGKQSPPPAASSIEAVS